jgi:hypothetical protein
MNEKVFPGDVLSCLDYHFKKPRASTFTDHQLLRVLKKYDSPAHSECIESLPFDALFRLPDGRHFIKKEKLRHRYRCIRLDTKRIYLFNPLAQVFRA